MKLQNFLAQANYLLAFQVDGITVGFEIHSFEIFSRNPLFPLPNIGKKLPNGSKKTFFSLITFVFWLDSKEAWQISTAFGKDSVKCRTLLSPQLTKAQDELLAEAFSCTLISILWTLNNSSFREQRIWFNSMIITTNAWFEK